MEANRKPAEATTETNGNGSTRNRLPSSQETGWRPDHGDDDPPGESRKVEDHDEGKPRGVEVTSSQESDQKPDANVSPLEDMPSSGRFANLAEEFDARAQSRELAKQHNAARDQATKACSNRDPAVVKLDDASIRGRIDPLAPDRDAAEGRKEPFQQSAKGQDSEWTDGVQRFDELPTGEGLSEEKRSNFDRFRAKAYRKLDDIKDDAEKAAKAIDRIFGPRPTGHAETRADHGPVAVDTHHSGIDPGSAASTMLAVGIVGAELVRKVHEKMRRRDH